jgi:ABC-2 type transport system ATP-binding protein
VLTARFKRDPDRARLAELPGIKNVERDDDGSWRLYHEPAAEPAEALVQLAVRQDWGLVALIPQHATLEDIFVELTTEDVAAAEPAA